MGNQQRDDFNYVMRDSTYLLAAVVELIFGLSGFLGVGWMYARRYNFGLLLAFGFFILLAVETFFSVVTFGFALCVFVPLNLAILFVSAFKVRDYVVQTRAKGDVFVLFAVGLVWMLMICGGCFILSTVATTGTGAFLIELNEALEGLPTPAPLEWP